MGTWWQRNWLPYRWVALGLLVVTLLGPLITQGCTPAIDTNVGELAPAFTLTDLRGKQVSLNDFQGKTVILNFWATWCPPCRAEMPEIEALYQEYKDRGVVIIGVDIQETEQEVRQFVQENGYSWTFLLDTSGRVAANYKIVALPTTFFLDTEGLIQTVYIGSMTKREMETKLTEAMR
ncbi:Thiol-disulfide oxidoreductase ResA [subsurface metagenome]